MCRPICISICSLCFLNNKYNAQMCLVLFLCRKETLLSEKHTLALDCRLDPTSKHLVIMQSGWDSRCYGVKRNCYWLRRTLWVALICSVAALVRLVNGKNGPVINNARRRDVASPIPPSLRVMPPGYSNSPPSLSCEWRKTSFLPCGPPSNSRSDSAAYKPPAPLPILGFQFVAGKGDGGLARNWNDLTVH